MNSYVASGLDDATYDIRKSYGQLHQKEKINYYLLSTYFYSKDNILYMYGDSFDYDISKTEGSYEAKRY